ncbi:hypothetical protein [Ectopseudomonas guguanensis]|uniref:hypothetical protein n=1 Tax=Ectopseudomonas guguanensis TaxID=1198456 RepID=UPI003CFDDE6C
MKKEVFTNPLQFSEQELQARKERAKERILNGYYNEREWAYPAVNHLVFNSYEQVLQAVAEQVKAGNNLFTGHPLRMPIPGFFEVMFYKPEAEIQSLIAAECERVEAEYRQSLADDLENKRQILISQMVAQEKLKEEKKLQEKEKKILDQATADADAYIQSLMKEVK